ncbi:hypothetical protein J6590_082044 [Homalodisca vitripennis]|nr:hypothetical protein J6590_082044 [Homalodisca vitripennis]
MSKLSLATPRGKNNLDHLATPHSQLQLSLSLRLHRIDYFIKMSKKLSGAQRRKLTKDSELAHSALLSKVPKLTKFFTIAEGTTQQPTSSLLATSNTQDFDHECEQDLILTEVEETAEILKEETNADLNERSDECCFESVSVVLYGDSFFYHQTRSKEVVLVLLGK